MDAIDDLGYFEPKSLTVVPRERGNKIDLLFVVFEAPVLDSVSIEGSTRLMDAELNAVFEGLIGLPLSHTGVTAAVKKIQAMYVDHAGGFPNSAPVITERISYSSLERLVDSGKAKVFSIPRILIAPRKL
ncbi:MAG: POTRA domain-containing protein [Candidatus Melainabacteria bacterium]|nr:POTRA domain-containing protein [Candidatus Melainabacteria bacterium]